MPNNDAIEPAEHTAHSTEAAHEHAVKAVIVQMTRQMEDATLSRGKLARMIAYSPFHFDRIFRSLTGVPPRLYLSALRFQRSKKLLSKSELSATEVSQMVGYSSFGTFSANFSRFVGLSPQQFRTFIEESNLRLSELRSIRLLADGGKGPNVEGTIQAPPGFSGIICIGLFPKPIPLGKPAACTIVFESGAYTVPGVPDGTYYVMSIAFAWDDTPEEYLHPRNAIRGKASGKVTVKNGIATTPSTIALRPPKFYDPPIIISMPVLVQSYLGRLELDELEEAADATIR